MVTASYSSGGGGSAAACAAGCAVLVAGFPGEPWFWQILIFVLVRGIQVPVGVNLHVKPAAGRYSIQVPGIVPREIQVRKTFTLSIPNSQPKKAKR